MSCNHPNLCVQYNKTLYNKQGEPYKAVHMVKNTEIQEYEYNTFEFWNKHGIDQYFYEGKKRYRILDIFETACGKCKGCFFDKAKENAIRNALESTEYKNNWFITFTYDDQHVPKSEDCLRSHTNEITGQIYELDDPNAMTLNKEDMITFFKDLRRQWKYHYNHDGIRFYGSGEYGPSTERPHYHYIIYNLPIDEKDLKPLGRNRNNQQLWTNEKIQEIWGKGYISIGKVTYESCAYVAQYCTKKQGQALYGEVKEEFYKRQGKMPEFVHMSRKPGIGRRYYEKNFWDIYKNDEIIIQTKKGITKVHPSSYYDNLFDQDGYEEYLKELKEARREKAKEDMKCTLSRTTLTEKEYLLQRERTLIDRTKILKRNGLDTALKY